MAHDALERSLSERERSLEQQVRNLDLIVNHLLNCINETRDEVGSNSAKIGRCAAMASSASARAELAIEKAREAVPAARDAALEELLRIAEAANDDGPRHAEPKKRRKLPPGWGGIVASGVVALAVLKAHRAASLAAGALVLTAAAAPVAGTLIPDIDAPRPPAAVAHHHPFRPGRHVPSDPATSAVLPPRRRPTGAAAPVGQRKRQPSPRATPSPSPTVPVPVPSPTVTVPPPVPSPSPTACHGKHCHGGHLTQVLPPLITPVAALGYGP